MKKIKSFILQLIFSVIFCTFNSTVYAESVDSYFVWEIKNFDDYKAHQILFQSLLVENGIIGLRDDIYQEITYGRYNLAIEYSELAEAAQKIAFGKNYIDENLIELTAKLYLMANELDKAEQKIKFLLNNAPDNLVKIRALNLQSELLNRKGNYREALKVTEEVNALLSSNSDEKLSLINQARIAKAYLGLNETKKSLAIAEKIYPQMQNSFGNAGIETLSLMSTLADDYIKIKRYEDGGKILETKISTIGERYGQNDPVMAVKSFLEFAAFYFDTGDKQRGEELLNVLLSEDKSINNGNLHSSLQLYKTFNETAVKYLDGNNPIVLKSVLVLAKLEGLIGDIPQSIDRCKKNLEKFKKVFGEQADETLMLMKVLGNDYTLLGKYSDAQKIFNAMLNVCQKNFGDNGIRTIESKIELANVLYKTGQYTTADKLLADIENSSRDILESDLPLQYDFAFVKAVGAYMKGDYSEYVKCIVVRDRIRENQPDLLLKNVNAFDAMETSKMYAVLGLMNNLTEMELMSVNHWKGSFGEYNPKLLKMLNEIAETQAEFGELKSAENLSQQVFELSRKHFGENNFYEWMALKTLAEIRRAEGNFTDALTIDKKALQIAEEVCGKKSLERLQTLDSIASDCTAAENFTEAIKIRENALNEYKKILEIEDAATLKMMTNLADNYVSVKRYADAVKLCDETISKQKVPTYVDGHLAPYESVIDLFHIKSLAQRLAGNSVDSAENYRQLIQAYETKRSSFSQEFFNDSKKTSKWFAEIIPDYKSAATVFISNKVNDKDFAFYCSEFCKGRNLIDRYNDVLVSKNDLLDRNENRYLNYLQKALESCQTISEYAKTTSNYILRDSVEILDSMLRFENTIYKNKLREKYSNSMMPKDPQKREKFEHKTNVEDTLKNFVKNFDIKKNQQAIPDGACLVEFMKVSDDSLLVLFLHNSGGVDAENIAIDKEFFEKCRLYHELNSYPDTNALHNDGKYLWQIGNEYMITTARTAPVEGAVSVNDKAKWDELRQELSDTISQKLIPPIEKYVGNSSHWIISPDAELNLVPFETLIYRNNPVVKSVDVSYVPSLAVLNLMKQRERKNYYLGQSKELFAMGDAIYGNNDESTSRGSQLNFFNTLRSNSDAEIDITTLKWNNLPGTARELDKVSTLFEDKDVFRKSAVTEKNLRQLNTSGELSEYKYLLFATHGLFVPDKPEVSSIVLSQQFNDNETDGYITVGEWMGYDLRSNLVYLSACESGLGGYQAGEGIVGIPYALTVAGNKDTVMSLWKVDDEATAEFTSAVFDKLSKGKSEVAALNETKREFLSSDNYKYNNPSVWAAFLLYGI